MKKDGGGKRYNTGKLRWDLLPIPAIEEVIKVYTEGGKKYDWWNWYRGMKYSTSYAAGMRHRTKWWGGETLDKELGTHHLANSIWNDLTNLTFELEGRKNLDDRIGVM